MMDRESGVNAIRYVGIAEAADKWFGIARGRKAGSDVEIEIRDARAS
ncbi:hypothetical protein [Neorhizobium sp. T25_27]|nr:hypothetical protein [Neorhizobium sp. T25_27]